MGWYKVPANANVRIQKRVRTPSIQHYTDNELANQATFRSYTSKNLDLRTTWNIDTDITVIRANDPGNTAYLSNVSTVTESAGNGVITQQITR